MSKQKSEVTVEAVTRAVRDGRLTSLTQVSKSLGLGKGSVSGSVARRLRELLPAIDGMLAGNKAAGDGDETADAGGAKPKSARKLAKQVAGRKPAGKSAFPVPDCCPYRHSSGNVSGYAMLFSILYAHRDKGINKRDLLKHYRAWSRKSERHSLFDLTVVASPKQDGSSCHRSAAKASLTYYIERENDFLRLHLVSESKK